jgi:hypothetical protein
MNAVNEFGFLRLFPEMIGEEKTCYTRPVWAGWVMIGFVLFDQSRS